MPTFYELAQAMAAQQAQLEGQKQKNALAAIQNQYAPDYFNLTNQNLQADIPKKQADTRYTNALTTKVPAEIQELQARAYYQSMEGKYIPTKYNLEQQRVNQAREELNRVSQYRGSYGKALADAQDVKKMYGENSPEYQEAIGYANRVATGASTSSGRGGGPNYIDPATGKAYAQLTTAQKTRLEKGLSANMALAQDMPSVVASITPYLGAAGQAAYLRDTALSYVGKGDPKTESRLADYRAGTAKIIENIERAMTGLNVNITDKATTNLNKVLAPNRFDSPKTYETRVTKYVQDLMVRARDQAALLRKGVPIDPNDQIVTLIPEGGEGPQTINLQNPSAPMGAPPPMPAAARSNAPGRMDALQQEMQRRGIQ